MGLLQRIRTSLSKGIEPAISGAWDGGAGTALRKQNKDLGHQLEDLVVLAHTVACETGVDVFVARSDYSVAGVPQAGFYSIRLPHSSSGPHTYADARSWLWGFLAGVEEMRWQARR